MIMLCFSFFYFGPIHGRQCPNKLLDAINQRQLQPNVPYLINKCRDLEISSTQKVYIELVHRNKMMLLTQIR